MKKRLAIASAVVVLLILVGVLVSRELFENSVAPTVPVATGLVSAVAPPPMPTGLRVTSLKGKAEARKQGGDWQRIRVGDELKPTDRLRTASDASVDVSMGDSLNITVAGGTEFTVGEMSEKLSDLKLEGGRLAADVRGEKMRLQVTVAQGDAVAETSDGKFAVVSAGDGDMRVGTERGNVKLSANGATVEIPAGKLSVVEPGEAPSKPQDLPNSLFLKVRKPKTTAVRRKRTMLVTGTATPGALVRVNDVRVRVGRDGVFKTQIKLNEGRNDIQVTAEDIAGRAKSSKLPTIVRDSTPPSVRGKVTW